jgi:hypothetical protein
MSAPYRIHNPVHGVTDSHRSEPPASRSSAPPRPSAGFSVAVYFAAAEMLALEGHFESARRAAERGTKLAPPEPEAQALYAWILYRCERPATARVSASPVSALVWSQIDAALARDSSCALAHYFKSVLLQRTGQVHDARWHLLRGRELDPDQSAADRALALLDDE